MAVFFGFYTMDEYSQIREVIEPIVADLDYEIVRLKWLGGQTAGGRANLQLMVEPIDGSQTKIEICEQISREASALLDVEDVIMGEYNLEVSSPGLDRPLTRLKDFERFKEFLMKLETREMIDGRKRFTGKVVNVEGEIINFEPKEKGLKMEDAEESGIVAIEFQNIFEAKLVMTDELVQSVMKKKKKEK